MFRNVPGCSGMFHVPGFVNARLQSKQLQITGEINIVAKLFQSCL